MIQKPDNWNELTPDEKRTMRFDAWIQADGIEFESPEAKAKFRERATLFRDAIEMKKTPKRVPITGLRGAYALRRVGIPQKATLYDRWDEVGEAIIKFQKDFDADSAANLFLLPGESMEVLGLTNLRWAGHGLADDIQYQSLEQEYMKVEEYDLFLNDPSDFILRYYMPRVNSNLKGLKKLPKFSTSGLGGRIYSSFMNPEIFEAFEILKKAGELAKKPTQVTRDITRRMNAMGYPNLSGAGAPGSAPYDILGDNLRGTMGVMMDLRRCPEKIVEACEKILSLSAKPDVPLGGAPMSMIPLHKGADEFMSREQFEKFYWPTFKARLMGLIEEGIVPMPFAEGGMNNRLDYLTELPKGSIIWYFDRTDMHKAKDVLGDHCCIMGNVPSSLIATGTAEQVSDYCRDLIDYCGKGGGFILSPGCEIAYGKEDTVRALVDTCKEYGVYK